MSEFAIQGLPISELAAKYGTPFYLYDGNVAEHGYAQLRELLHPRADILYSLKSNPNAALFGLLHERGAGAEVSSLAELETVRRVAGNVRTAIFVGPSKSEAELEACVALEVRAIVCESLVELARIEALAARTGARPKVMLRVNPTFGVKGSRLTMGGVPRQFGIDEEELRSAPASLRTLRHARLTGIHVYMGTRILDADVIAQNTARILAMAEQLAVAIGFELELVDVGGGFGVPYFADEGELDLPRAVTAIGRSIDAFAARHSKARVIIELGRYLSAPCGMYVVRVNDVKVSSGETFLICDGGTNHHMAAVGVGSVVHKNFPVRSLTAWNEPATRTYHVAGPLCTPNDLLGKKVCLPPVASGDFIGVLRSGAYGPTASPVYFLSHGYPAEILIHHGRDFLVRERDTTDDLLRKQVFGHVLMPQPIA